MSNGVPQTLSSAANPRGSRVTLSPTQQASSVAEPQQIILSAPLPVIPHTSDAASTPQSLPDQLKAPELPIANSDLQQANDAPLLSPLEAVSEISRKPLHTEPSMEYETERVVPESSCQPLPDPVEESSVRQQDVPNKAANIEDSIAQYENPLQKELDDEIHQQAAEVMQEVGGGRRNVKTNCQRPFDPNLVCPMCRRQFRIGEIQKFKKHVSTCTGSDD